MAHVVVGGMVGVAWLVLPWMTDTDTGTGGPAATAGSAPPAARAATPGAMATADTQDIQDIPGIEDVQNVQNAENSRHAQDDDGTATADLVLPLLAAGTAGALAAYGYARRRRRARTRTTPGGGPAGPVTPLSESDVRTRTLLVEIDDSVRTSQEELAFVEARFDAEAVEPFVRAVRDAESELSAAFRLRQRYDASVEGEAPESDPLESDTARRETLRDIAARCTDAGRRLDAEAAAFDRLRALERDTGEALGLAEARFRELAARTGAAEAVLADLGGRYAPSAARPVIGHIEQAKDRLVFATTHLNRARQSTDMGDPYAAAPRLRAAEGAVSQAAVFVGGVERLAAELAAAVEALPAALAGAEEAVTGAGGPLERTSARMPVGELRALVAHAEAVLAGVREETAAGPYDPLGALRRIARATAPLGAGRADAVRAAALIAARNATAAAADFVTTHRGAVGGAARTRLAEAQRLLAPDTDPSAEDCLRADALAHQARELAERDIRTHGNPYTGSPRQADGTGGAVLGGVLLGGRPDGGPPASFGGPATRARRGLRTGSATPPPGP
ncbi:hypothetical protein [Streptomyces sporangiiformans]|uniref:hypothetical protein n=1 Tax=Streptomyces sporangiiformans TaxID=2315329 RepID=UPI001F08D0D6|nr:hypothetical protein [Streptomyces sporangiiformans]